MNTAWQSILFGIMFLTYAGVTFYVRSTTPKLYRNLVRMKEAYGEKAGDIIHLLLFSFVPFVAGLYFMGRAFMGKGLF